MRRNALVSALLLGFVGLLAAPAHAVSVCGSITTNTTWTIADSPVLVTCNVVVYPGVNLTINPGVTVSVTPPATITIRGVLSAVGTSGSHVVFQSSTQPTKWGGIAVENTVGGSATLQYVDLSYANTATSVQCCGGTPPSLQILDSNITNSSVGSGGYTGSPAIIRRSVFSGNTSAITGADKDIFDSTFSGNGCGICTTERVNVYSSYFTGNTSAITGARGVLRNSLISNNTTGLDESFEEGMNLASGKNTITANGVGIKLPHGFVNSITYNNIYGNTTYNVRVQGSGNVDVGSNYWGTTNQAVIDAGNYDALDQSGLGLLLYSPLLTQAVTSDTTPPETSITSSPAGLSNSSAATFAFASTENPSTFQCRIDSGPFGSCVTPKSYTGLTDGTHTFEVRATDNDSNLDLTPASSTWTIDTVAPDTTILSGPSGGANPSSATFTFSATESGTFECALDDAAFAACTSPVSVSALADGGHAFRVRAVDSADNADPSPAERFWTVDATPPSVQILTPAAPGLYVNDMQVSAGGNTPVVIGPLTIIVRATDAGSGVASFVLSIDGLPMPATFDVSSGTYRYTWTGYLPGLHQIDATATDLAGLSTTVGQEVLGVVG